MRQGVGEAERGEPEGSPPGGERPRQLRSLSLSNFLSYGPERTEFTFGSLNVLVGPNGSGKTNLIEALRVMRSSTTRFGAPMLSGGGVEAYVWHGGDERSTPHVEVHLAIRSRRPTIRHEIDFLNLSGEVVLSGEFIGPRIGLKTNHPPYAFERTLGGGARLVRRDPEKEDTEDEFHARILGQGRLRNDESGIEKRRDPETFPILADLAEFYESIAIFGEWTIGRNAPPRNGVAAGTKSDRLEEDASNLANVLLELRRTAALPKLRSALRRLKATYEDFSVSPVGAQYQLYVEEEGVVGGINALRLSDGTLRFLALAAVLLHPKPPALVVIDEPEIGMHPDLIEAIAEMILEAAGRTQLIIATHSPEMLTALRKGIDRLYAFGAGVDGTTVRGFDRGQLDAYLAEEPLGELWRQGDFGGNRF